MAGKTAGKGGRRPTEEEQEGKQPRKLLKVVDALLRGEPLTTKDIMRLADLSDSQARKYRRYLKEELSGLQVDGDGLRLPRHIVSEPFSDEAVTGASIMGSVARMFDGTKYAKGVQEVVEAVAMRASPPRSTNDFARKFIFAVRGGDPAVRNNPAWLERIIEGILTQTKVDIDYLSFGGETVNEVVDPLSLLVYDHQLYVVVRDENGKIRKPRRFSRIRGVELTTRRFEYPAPSEYEPTRELSEVWGVFLGHDAKIDEIVVRFAETYRTYVENHHWHPTQKLIDRDRLHVRFLLRPCFEFEEWILGMGSHLEVLSPPALREQIIARINDAARVYVRPDEDTPRGQTKPTTKRKSEPARKTNARKRN